jgi:hypothetical protein
MGSIDKHYTLLERVALTAIAILVYVWIFKFDGIPHSSLQPDDALPIVAAISSLASSLLGFILAVTVFLLGLSSTKSFAILRASTSYPEFWSVFKGGILSSATCAMIGIISIAMIWLQQYPPVLAWLLLWSTVWLGIKVARIIWVLHMVINAEVSQGQNSRKKI